MDNLLPCPFCGGKAYVWMQQRVVCNGCDAEGPECADGNDTDLADNISAWNRRAHLATPAANGPREADAKVKDAAIKALRKWEQLLDELPQNDKLEDAEFHEFYNLKVALDNASEYIPQPGMVTVPREPTPGLLMSMAIRYDHGLGVDGYYDQPLLAGNGAHKQRLESTLRTMRQLHEEVTLRGFYKPERESAYSEQLDAALRSGGRET